MDRLKVILLGDVHGGWDTDDQAYYTAADAQLLLWTGDLGEVKGTDTLCAQLAALGGHSFGVLGNHDGATLPHVIAEALGQDTLALPFRSGHVLRVRRLREILGPHDLGFRGVDLPELGLAVVGMRPHSTGGARIHFRRALREVYGVDDPLAAHRAAIDGVAAGDLVLLGHNGPAGLGAEATSPFGVDWRAGGGDNGDPDYAEALRHARAAGKRVLFAVGGHMHDRLHRATRHLGERVLTGLLDGVPVINACRVPRLERRSGRGVHHHTEVVVDREAGWLSVERVAWTPGGEVHRTGRWEAALAAR